MNASMNASMLYINILFIFLCSGMASWDVVACSVKKKKQIVENKYIENLAVHRILFSDLGQQKKEQQADAMSHRYDVTDKLDNLLAKRKDTYKTRGSISGYTIQVYKGSSRSTALQLREKILRRNPNYKPTIRFVQPFYEVLVGFFLEQLEAYKMYSTIKEYIPLAMMRPFLFSQEEYQQYSE